jgi:hypothetical protein
LAPFVGRIQRIDLRKFWRHEANDFTRWLAENLDLPAEAAGTELTLVEREAAAADFNVALLAKDGAGRFDSHACGRVPRGGAAAHDGRPRGRDSLPMNLMSTITAIGE